MMGEEKDEFRITADSELEKRAKELKREAKKLARKDTLLSSA